MISFATQFAGTDSDSMTVANPAVGEHQCAPQHDVGERRLSLSIRELQAHVAETHLLKQLAKARWRGLKSVENARELVLWHALNRDAEDALLEARRALADESHLTMGGEWTCEVDGRRVG